MLRTTAAIALIATLPSATLAQDNMSSDYASGTVSTESLENLIRASEVQGSEVYTVGADYDTSVWEETPYYEEIEAEWEQVGVVTDIALTPDGQMTGLIVEHGGFLDIGDDHVLLNLDDIKFASVDEDSEYTFVTRYSGDEIEEMREVEENWW